MNKFTVHRGKSVPLYQPNIDTDQIVPKKFLLSVGRTGFDRALFYDWRFNSDGSPKESFVLNNPKYSGATVLIAGANFGCGSSREHAPWALAEYGFRAVIAPGFADIFYNNCFKTGILPVILDEEVVLELVNKTAREAEYFLTVDLESKKVSDEYDFKINFEVDDFRRECLLKGLDDIELTLQYEAEITEFENRRISRNFLDTGNAAKIYN